MEGLPEIARLSIVAMVEWQVPAYPMNRISTRAIQARRSVTYESIYGTPSSAEELGPGPVGYTGLGVNIAIVDSGIDPLHEAFSGRFLGGYDATTTPPSVISSSSATNRDPGNHGTPVAGIALGGHTSPPNPPDPYPILKCWQADDGSSQDCAGVAPAAGLVDIKVCVHNDPTDPCRFRFLGYNWLATNAQSLKIRVVNISVGQRCADSDGKDVESVIVDHLVSLGMVVATSHGNANPCINPPCPPHPPTCPIGDRLTHPPGSSSFAMTIAATEDDQFNQTVNRNNDVPYNAGLTGPRQDFDQNPNPLALKPDFSAPGFSITAVSRDTTNRTDIYDINGGTSAASALVAGAAALIIEARPTITPGSLKDLLKRTAVPRPNVNPLPLTSSYDPNWDRHLGSGIINVFDALSLPRTDVRFPSCVDPPRMFAGLCDLSTSDPPWNNTNDITTISPPMVGVPNTIRAKVQNKGAATRVLVTFGIYHFAAGNRTFYHVGTVRRDIPANATVDVDHPWTPADKDHQCIQVSIEYGVDSHFENNVTQRNVQVSEVAPYIYKARIENPFMIPARFVLKPMSDRERWKCRVNDESFILDPLTDCSRDIKITFTPPPGTPSGEKGNCNVAVFATPKESDKPILIGGVTAQAVIPKPCKVVGQIVDTKGNPVPNAKVLIFSSAPIKPIRGITDKEGNFLIPVPFSLYNIAAEAATAGKGKTKQYLECGPSKKRFVLSGKELKLF